MDSFVSNSFANFVSSGLKDIDLYQSDERQIGIYSNKLVQDFSEAYGITSDEDIAELNRISEEETTKFKNENNILRYIPTQDEMTQLYKPLDLSRYGTQDEKISAIDKWREESLAQASVLRPADADDIKTHLNHLSNNFIRQEVGKETGRFGDFGNRLIQGLGETAYNLFDYEGSQRFFAEHFPENPTYDDSIVGQIAAGIGDTTTQVLISVASGLAAGPKAAVGTIMAYNAARVMKSAYEEEMQRSNNPEIALNSAVNQIPSVALESLADTLVVGRFGKIGIEAKTFRSAFAKAATDQEKRDLIKQFIPEVGRHTLLSGLSEATVGGVGAEFTSGYGSYLATGDEKYIRTTDQLFQSAIVEGAVGSIFGAAGAGIQKSSAYSEIAGTNPDQINAIKEALKKGDIDEVVRLSSLPKQTTPPANSAATGSSVSSATNNTATNAAQAQNPQPSQQAAQAYTGGVITTPFTSIGMAREEQAKYNQIIRRYESEQDPQRKAQLEPEYNRVVAAYKTLLSGTYTPQNTFSSTLDDGDLFFDIPNEKPSHSSGGIVAVELEDGSMIPDDYHALFYTNSIGPNAPINLNGINRTNLFRGDINIAFSGNQTKGKLIYTDPNGNVQGLNEGNKPINLSTTPKKGWTPILVNDEYSPNSSTTTRKIRFLSPVKNAKSLSKESYQVKDFIIGSSGNLQGIRVNVNGRTMFLQGEAAQKVARFEREKYIAAESNRIANLTSTQKQAPAIPSAPVKSRAEAVAQHEELMNSQPVYKERIERELPILEEKLKEAIESDDVNKIIEVGSAWEKLMGFVGTEPGDTEFDLALKKARESVAQDQQETPAGQNIEQQSNQPATEEEVFSGLPFVSSIIKKVVPLSASERFLQYDKYKGVLGKAIISVSNRLESLLDRSEGSSAYQELFELYEFLDSLRRPVDPRTETDGQQQSSTDIEEQAESDSETQNVVNANSQTKEDKVNQPEVDQKNRYEEHSLGRYDGQDMYYYGLKGRVKIDTDGTAILIRKNGDEYIIGSALTSVVEVDGLSELSPEVDPIEAAYEVTDVQDSSQKEPAVPSKMSGKKMTGLSPDVQRPTKSPKPLSKMAGVPRKGIEMVSKPIVPVKIKDGNKEEAKRKFEDSVKTKTTADKAVVSKAKAASKMKPKKIAEVRPTLDPKRRDRFNSTEELENNFIEIANDESVSKEGLKSFLRSLSKAEMNHLATMTDSKPTLESISSKFKKKNPDKFTRAILDSKDPEESLNEELSRTEDDVANEINNISSIEDSNIEDYDDFVYSIVDPEFINPIAAQTLAKPSGDQILERIQSRFGVGVTVVDTNQTTPTGFQWKARRNKKTGDIQINSANVSSLEEAEREFAHEVYHAAYSDPDLKREADKIIKNLDRIGKETKKSILDIIGYSRIDATEESNVRRLNDLLDKWNQRSEFSKFVQSIKTFLKKALFIELSENDLQKMAHNVFMRTLRDTDVIPYTSGYVIGRITAQERQARSKQNKHRDSIWNATEDAREELSQVSGFGNVQFVKDVKSFINKDGSISKDLLDMGRRGADIWNLVTKEKAPYIFHPEKGLVIITDHVMVNDNDISLEKRLTDMYNLREAASIPQGRIGRTFRAEIALRRTILEAQTRRGFGFILSNNFGKKRWTNMVDRLWSQNSEELNQIARQEYPNSWGRFSQFTNEKQSGKLYDMNDKYYDSPYQRYRSNVVATWMANNFIDLGLRDISALKAQSILGRSWDATKEVFAKTFGFPESFFGDKNSMLESVQRMNLNSEIKNWMAYARDAVSENPDAVPDPNPGFNYSIGEGGGLFTEKQIADHLKDVFGASPTIVSTRETTPTGKQWNARRNAETGEVQINALNISSLEEAEVAFREEVFHSAYSNKNLKESIDEIVAIIPDIGSAAESLVQMGYNPSEVREEEIVKRLNDLVDQWNARGSFDKFIQKIKTFFKDMFGIKLNELDAQLMAYNILTQALSDINSSPIGETRYSIANDVNVFEIAAGKISSDKKQK